MKKKIPVSPHRLTPRFLKFEKEFSRILKSMERILISVLIFAGAVFILAKTFTVLMYA